MCNKPVHCEMVKALTMPPARTPRQPPRIKLRYPPAPSVDTSETSDTSGTISPNSQMMEVCAPSTPQKNDTLETDAKVPITKFSQKTHSDGKTVAMSIGAPRLTANGKRIGRPPGTFKAQREESNKKNAVMLKHTTCKWNHCNIDFYTVNAIVDHVYTEHVADKECTCLWEGCDGRVFKSFYMLVSHLRCHTGERPQKCDYPGCNKSYKTKENLNTHKRSHTGEKPFMCQFTDVCNKQFTNASDRGKHENRCHTSEKYYFCDIENCPKRYTDPSSLRKHVICHHGREHLENRTKIKVRWVYRRDGQVVDPQEGEKSQSEPADQKKEENENPVPPVLPLPYSPTATENQFLLPPQMPSTPAPQLGQENTGSAFRPVMPRAQVPLNNFMLNNPGLLMADPAKNLLFPFLNTQPQLFSQSTPFLMNVPQAVLNQPMPTPFNFFNPLTSFVPTMPLLPFPSANFSTGLLGSFDYQRSSVIQSVNQSVNQSMPAEVLIRYL